MNFVGHPTNCDGLQPGCFLLARLACMLAAAEMRSMHALSVRVKHAARCCNSWVATAAACESNAGTYLHMD
jgi:hypothetical protein